MSQNLYNNTPNQGQGSKQPTASHDAVIGDTYSFSPTLQADFRLAFHRLWFCSRPAAMAWMSARWVPHTAKLQSSMTSTQLPGVDLPGQYRGFSGIGQVISPSTNNEILIYANATKVLGRHSIKFGGDVRHDYFSYIQANRALRRIYFHQRLHRAERAGQRPQRERLSPPSCWALPLRCVPGLQQHRPERLVAGILRQRHLPGEPQAHRHLGLRWELPGVWSVGHDSGTVLQLDAPDPLSKTTGLNLRGQQVLLNSDLYPDRHILNRNFHLFEPRVGIAYRLNDKTVIRVGAGRSFLPAEHLAGHVGLFLARQRCAHHDEYPANGFIPGELHLESLPERRPEAVGTQSRLRQQHRGQQHERRSAQRKVPGSPCSGTSRIGRQLPGNSSLEVSYAGNKGTHLSTGNQASQSAVGSVHLEGAELVTQVPNPFFGKLPAAANSALTGATIRAGQLLRPFPQYINVTNAVALYRQRDLQLAAGKVPEALQRGRHDSGFLRLVQADRQCRWALRLPRIAGRRRPGLD